MKTSRDILLDQVEVIANYIAISSHYIELSNFYRELGKEDKYQECIDFALSYSEQRRNMMSSILKSYDGDKNYWCILKHSIGIYGYCSEIFLSSPTKDNEAALNDSYNNMVSSLCRFCSLKEITTCGRCLTDMVSLHTNEGNG